MIVLLVVALTVLAFVVGLAEGKDDQVDYEEQRQRHEELLHRRKP